MGHDEQQWSTWSITIKLRNISNTYYYWQCLQIAKKTWKFGTKEKMLSHRFIPQILIDSPLNVGHIISLFGYTVGPPYPRAVHLQIQPNFNQKYLWFESGETLWSRLIHWHRKTSREKGGQKLGILTLLLISLLSYDCDFQILPIIIPRNEAM